MNKKTILWDFDGVILNSNKIRDLGFIQVLKKFPQKDVSELIEFHQANGGLSRYVKFRYFFEKIRNENISETEIQKWTNQFSSIMKELLIDKSLLIDDSLNYIKSNFHKYNMHIVSGSDGNELRYLCEKLNIKNYFLSIQGSPTPKKQLVEKIINQYNYKTCETYLIGDSINDFEAAIENKINFYGYNNTFLKTDYYIKNFNNFKL